MSEARPNTKPIRVLIAAPSLDILGGQARQAVRLREGLSSEPSLQVGFIPHNPRLPFPLRWLQRIKYIRTIATALYYILSLLVTVPRYDVVHVFSASYYSYLTCAVPPILIAKLFGKRSILNYRSGEAEDHLQNWRLTARPIMRLADVIVVPSGYLVDLFGRFDLPARAIYNLVELDRFTYRERRPLKPIFLTSRLLEPLYNVGCVLRAFALIQKEYPEAELTVAADGYMRAELEQLAVDLNLKATRFIGPVPFDQMPAMYDAADIYLTATNLDNMPASITECMACGVPVVTTDAGGIPYIVKHEESCLMIEKDDHVAMAAAAIRLLRDNDLAVRLTERARADSVKFTWSSVRAEWIKQYQELVPDRVSQTASESNSPSRSQPSESSARL